MKTLAELKEKTVLVVGLGKTGFSVCAFLDRQGVSFEVVDDRPSPPNIENVRSLSGDIVINQRFEASLFNRFDVLVVSPGVALSTPAIAGAIERGALAIGDIELFAMSLEAPVIAVTGSNGKSSVVAWLFEILDRTEIKSVLCGNIGQPVLDSLNPDADLYVVELSSFQLETTFSLAPISATVLNIAEDHMDRYKNLEEYARVKRTIYKSSAYIVANSLDPLTQPESGETRADAEVVQFGADDEKAEFKIENHGNEKWLVTPLGKVLATKDIVVPGQHNLNNALAVLALLHPLVSTQRLTTEQVQEGLRSFKGLTHRTQLVSDYKGIRWFNDSKGTNVAAAIKAVEAMGVPVVLIAGGLGKGADFHPMRKVVQQKVKALVLLGEDAPLIAKALEDLVEPVFVDSMENAVLTAANLASEGDAVLLSPACSSFDMFENFEHRGEVFMQEVRKVAA